MEFRVLGPLSVLRRDDSVDVGGPRQRRLLAALLAHADQVVPTERLIDIVFGGEPPDGASTTIRSYVARLRRSLAAEDLDEGDPIRTQPSGYLFSSDGHRIDASFFESCSRKGRQQLADDAVGAVGTLEAALSLWRGSAYEEFVYENWAQPEALRLEELRIGVSEDLIEAQLACGMHDEVIPELRGLIADHSLRERLRRQLVLALHRAGRQAEALRVFEDFRRELIEIGLEPSGDLMTLERSVVAHDPALQLSTPAGRALRGYRLGAPIGEGRHGVVYEGLQPGTGREVAVKVIRSELVDEPSFIRRFDAEARIVAHLEHPHIVPLYDYWREPGGAYMVMRRLPESLQDTLVQGPLDATRVSVLADQLGAALAVAHRSGVVHGDIRPSNVLVDRDGNAYLADFGVATLIDDQAETDRYRPNSGYESPEIVAGERPGPASDQFALAILLVQALTGSLPFGTGSISTPHDRVRSIHVQRPGVPAAVDEVIWTATAWSPRDRFSDVSAFVTRFVEAVGGHSVALGREPDRANPYRGLRAFTEADAAYFFGRDAVVDEVIQQLGAGGRRGRFVTLVGASGSGKSSIVHAGVVPRLRTGALPGSDRWLIASIVPGSDPFAALIAGLRPIASREPVVPSGPPDAGWAAAVLRQSVQPEETVLLLVDQLEEIFTLVPSDTTRRAFLAGLAEAIECSELDLRVVATLRADFYDRPLSYQAAGELIKEGGITVIGMDAAEMDQAIREPAARVGVDVEPALASTLTAAVLDQPSALPLLQFAMTELYENRDGQLIDVGAYRALGGVEAAISSYAERIFSPLSDGDREIARRVLLRLVAVSDEATATRRRVLRSELLAPEPSRSDAARVIEAYGHARLLTFDRDPATREPTVEIAHEALIGHWPRLRQWVAEAGEGLFIQGHLDRAAQLWDRQGRDPGDLLRGARLEATERWAGDNPDALRDLERAFLDASVDQRDAERAAERQVAEQQRRSNTRLRRLLVGLGVTLVVALVAGFVAVTQRNAADRAANLATVRELTASSASTLDVDPQLSLLLALEAVETMRDSGSYLRDAEEALHRAVLNQQQLLAVPNHENGMAHFSPDGEHFVALTHPDTDTIPQIWSTVVREPVMDLIGHDQHVLDAVFSHDGSRVATASMDGTVRVWDVSTGSTERTFEGPPGGPTIPAFSPDGTRVAANSFDGEVWVWNLETGERTVLPTPEGMVGEMGFNLEFSPDGATLAAAYDNDAVPGAILWDLESQKPIRVFEGHEAVTLDVGFTPDGERLVTASADGTLKIWDAASGENTATFTEHDGVVLDLQISADGRWVASAGTPDVLVWDLESLDVLHRLVGHSGSVDGIDISPDGRNVVSGSWHDRSTRLWDVSPVASHELAAYPGPDVFPGAVTFAPDGRTLAATSGQGVALRDVATGAEISRFDGLGVGTFSLEYSPDSTVIATADWGGVKVWNRETGGDGRILVEGVVGRDVAFDPNGAQIAVATDTGTQIWPVRSGDPRPLRDYVSFAVDFSPDGERLAIAGLRNAPEHYGVEVVDPATGATIEELPLGFLAGGEQGRPILDLAFTPDGGTLITVSEDAVGVVWDTATWEPIRRLEGHDDMVVAVAADPSRDEVATASLDGTVKIWDLETGTTRLTFTGGPFADVSYSPDGRYLAVAGDTGPVQILILELEELVSAARERLTRDFTEAECIQYLHRSACPSQNREG